MIDDSNRVFDRASRNAADMADAARSRAVSTYSRARSAGAAGAARTRDAGDRALAIYADHTGPVIVGAVAVGFLLGLISPASSSVPDESSTKE